MSAGSPSAAPRAPAPSPQLTVEVFPATAFRVILGACLGEGLGRAQDAVPGDRFRLAPGAAALPLALAIGSGPPRVGHGGAVGAPGMAIRAEAEHRLVTEDGGTVAVLSLRLDGSAGFVLPLSPLAREADHVLIGSRPTAGQLPLPDRLAAAFTLGTTIVAADGTPQPVERLSPGLMILTRDNGPRPLRALLRARLRAVGEHAPVVFAPGTIGNAAELAVSPYHRILLYRAGATGEGDERFVQARHLVDGGRVRRREGGYADYLALVFDAHEVIYAEGFPCESLCLTPAVAGRLPGAMAADLAAGLAGAATAHRPRPTPEDPQADLEPFRG